MRDNRFIELLNLYIDRQISAAETVELEAEMQGNPRRRAIYRQYCQLHTATKQVYDSFRVNATEPQADLPAGRGVIAQFERRSRSHWIHYAGGLAAAACLALVVVRYNSPGASPVAQDLAPVASAPALALAAVEVPAPVVSAPVAVAAAPRLISLSNDLTAEPDYTAMLAALRREDQRAFARGEIQSTRPLSLFDDGVFDANRTVLPANSQRTYRGKQAPAQQAEFTAFQFQR